MSERQKKAPATRHQLHATIAKEYASALNVMPIDVEQDGLLEFLRSEIDARWTKGDQTPCTTAANQLRNVVTDVEEMIAALVELGTEHGETPPAALMLKEAALPAVLAALVAELQRAAVSNPHAVNQLEGMLRYAVAISDTAMIDHINKAIAATNA